MLIPTSADDNEHSHNVKISKFFSLVTSPSGADNVSSEISCLKHFLWKLLANRFELDFYLEDVQSIQTTQKGASKKSHSTSSLANSKKTNPKLSSIINEHNNRGFCANYYTRKCVNSVIKSPPPPPTSETNAAKAFSLTPRHVEIKSWQECVNEFNSRLIIVASQQQRNKVLCPSYKYLEFENLNDIEYSVLEEIAR